MTFSRELLTRAAGQRLVLVDGEDEVTYYALRSRVALLVSALEGTEVVPGDRVIVFADPSAFAIAAHLAAMEAECVSVPLSPGRSDEALDARIALAAPRYALVHEDLAARFAGLASSGRIEHVIVGPAPLRASHVTAGLEPDRHDPDDLLGIAQLLFARSRDGVRRAVRIGHDNLKANTEAIVDAMSLRPSDKAVLSAPLDDPLGASILHTHLWAGGTLHVGAEAGALASSLERARATGVYGDVADLVGALADRELSHLRYVAQPGGDVEARHLEALEARGLDRVFALYDRAEGTARLSVLSIHDHPEKRGSIGRGLPGTTLEVVDAEGAPVPAGEPGEIAARGPGVTRGYLEDWDANAAHFRDGGLRTGDTGVMDEDGFVFVGDRRPVE